MNYETVIQEALNDIPEFKTEYAKNIELNIIDNDSGVHIVFGYVFTPLLIEAIKQNPQLAVKMFDFVERMSASGNRLVQEVCDYSVLEAIADHIPVEEFNGYLGASTKEGLSAILKYIG